MSKLGDSIDRLYVAFADAPKPQQIDACPHCIDEKELRTLLDTPLRELSPHDLMPYGTSVFLTAGSEADFLYFLPRILEVSAMETAWWPSPQIVGRAIKTARPESWPAERLDAVKSFLAALIESIVQSGEFASIDDWMCGIARMGFDVRPHLAEITKSKAAVLSYFEDNARCLGDRRLCNTFWELPCAGHDAIVDWFYSDPIRWIPLEEYGNSLLV
jgi:hypothetical protein